MITLPALSSVNDILDTDLILVEHSTGEGFKMTGAALKDFINAQAVDVVSRTMSYSTEEHKTGRKWIDGKPTYEKTIDCGVLPNSTAKYVVHGINNLKKVIKSEGFSDNNAGTHIPVPYVSGNPLAISVDTTYIIIQASSDYTNFVNTQITIEYTKTTD